MIGSPAATTPPEAVLSVAEMLAGAGLYGFVWADTALVTVERYGPLVERIPLGLPLNEALLPLCGYDAEIQALRAGGRQLQLPNLALGDNQIASERFNLLVRWIEARGLYLVLVTRSLTRTADESDLHRQVRLRQMAEEKLQEQSREIERANAELTRANRELDQFAYVLSHDLRAPLRAMRLLVKDLDAALDAGDPELVQAITYGIGTQSQRMAAMMTGLYEYARIGRDIRTEEEVDTRALVETIVATLPVAKGFRVDITGEWPRIHAHAAPLDLVLRNLVENALKHHDRGGGLVSVGCVDLGSALRLTVADDGPGIPTDRHEAVFEPFVRLAEQPPVEGSGLGLSLVRKAAETVGGRVELAPSAGRGAEFIVTWPKRA